MIGIDSSHFRRHPLGGEVGYVKEWICEQPNLTIALLFPWRENIISVGPVSRQRPMPFPLMDFNPSRPFTFGSVALKGFTMPHPRRNIDTHPPDYVTVDGIAPFEHPGTDW